MRYIYGLTLLATGAEIQQGIVTDADYQKKATDVRNANKTEQKNNSTPRVTYWIRVHPEDIPPTSPEALQETI
jgi:hypothetical protein